MVLLVSAPCGWWRWRRTGRQRLLLAMLECARHGVAWALSRAAMDGQFRGTRVIIQEVSQLKPRGSFSSDVANGSLFASNPTAWSFVRVPMSAFVVLRAVPTGMTCVFYDCIGRAASLRRSGPCPSSRPEWHHRSRQRGITVPDCPPPGGSCSTAGLSNAALLNVGGSGAGGCLPDPPISRMVRYKK